MTVKITKPALNLREELADLRKPSGIAGEALLRADSVQEQRDLIGAGRKNLFINGGFDVWQRGTSSTNGGYSTVDRFEVANLTGTMSRSTSVPANKGFVYSIQYSGTSADCYFHQIIENSAPLRGRTATLSFWLNGDKTDLAPLRGFVYDGTYHSINGSLPDLTLIETVGTWNRYAVTHTFADGSYSPKIRMDFAENVASTIQTTGWQLELGSVATDFEHRSYGEELALCQRYYEVLVAGDEPVGTSSPWSSGGNYIPIRFAVEKRVSPTMSASGSVSIFESGGTTLTRSNLQVGHISTRACELYCTGGASGGFVRGTSASTSVIVDAEL